jgi:hypothetical protein
MEMKKRIIRTNNREIYEKFNLLHFSPEVVLLKSNIIQINKIIKNINKNFDILEAQDLGEYIIIKKKHPIDFSVYLS